MKRSLPVVAVPVLVVALLATGPLSSPGADKGKCTSVYAYRSVKEPLKVSSDLTVRLRNPYGARVNIGRYFVPFGSSTPPPPTARRSRRCSGRSTASRTSGSAAAAVTPICSAPSTSPRTRTSSTSPSPRPAAAR